jgi:hypothetical protein
MRYCQAGPVVRLIGGLCPAGGGGLSPWAAAGQGGSRSRRTLGAKFPERVSPAECPPEARPPGGVNWS